MDGYYHRNQHISGVGNDGIVKTAHASLSSCLISVFFCHCLPTDSSSWDQRYSSSAYDYNIPHGIYLNRRGSLPSGKYQGFMSSSGSTGGFYGSGGNMADSGLESTADNSKTNLIVNYLPQSMTDKDLYSLFVGFGSIESCRLMKDFKTGYSYGFGFVNYVREEDAIAAIQALNGFAVQNKRLKVSYARPSGDDIKETNLYVTGLPRDVSDTQLEVIFGKYGRIVQKHILRDKLSGMSRGVAFVRYDKREEAQEAISALNNVIPDGGSEPLAVRIAEEHGKKKAAYYAGWMAGVQNREGDPSDIQQSSAFDDYTDDTMPAYGDMPWGYGGMGGMDAPPYPPMRMAKARPNFYGSLDMAPPSEPPFAGKMPGNPKMLGRGVNRSGVRGGRGGRGGRGSPWNTSGDDRFKGGARNRNMNNFW